MLCASKFSMSSLRKIGLKPLEHIEILIENLIERASNDEKIYFDGPNNCNLVVTIISQDLQSCAPNTAKAADLIRYLGVVKVVDKSSRHFQTGASGQATPWKFKIQNLRLGESGWKERLRDVVNKHNSKLIKKENRSDTTIPQNILYSGAVKFIGRGEIIGKLENLLLRPSAKVAMIGIGGMGKTELAIHTANKLKGNFEAGICWIRARSIDINDEKFKDDNNSSLIIQQIIQFSEEYLKKVPPKGCSIEEKLSYCFKNWPSGDALFIFDDVENYNDISNIIPKDSRFKVLVTSRIKSPIQFSSIDVEELSEHESLELLSTLITNERLEKEIDDGKELCNFLGYLPLALELIGKFLYVDTSLKIEAVLSKLKLLAKQRKTIKSTVFDQEERFPSTANRGLYATFLLTWEVLSKSTQETAKIISILLPVSITWEFVENIINTYNSQFPEEREQFPDAPIKARKQLLLHSLLKPENPFSRIENLEYAQNFSTDVQQKILRSKLLESQQPPEKRGRYYIHTLVREFFRGQVDNNEYFNTIELIEKL